MLSESTLRKLAVIEKEYPGVSAALGRSITAFRKVLVAEGGNVPVAIAKFEAATAAMRNARLAKGAAPTTVAELGRLPDHGRQAAIVEAEDLERLAALGGGDTAAMREKAAALRTAASFRLALQRPKAL